MHAMVTCKTTAKNYSSYSSKTWSRIAMDVVTVFYINSLITVDFHYDFSELDTLPNKPKAASVIRCCKGKFRRNWNN